MLTTKTINLFLKTRIHTNPYFQLKYQFIKKFKFHCSKKCCSSHFLNFCRFNFYLFHRLKALFTSEIRLMLQGARTAECRGCSKTELHWFTKNCFTGRALRASVQNPSVVFDKSYFFFPTISLRF